MYSPSLILDAKCWVAIDKFIWVFLSPAKWLKPYFLEASDLKFKSLKLVTKSDVTCFEDQTTQNWLENDFINTNRLNFHFTQWFVGSQSFRLPKVDHGRLNESVIISPKMKTLTPSISYGKFENPILSKPLFRLWKMMYERIDTSIRLFEAETWSLNALEKNKPNLMEIKYLRSRRVLTIMDRIRNVETMKLYQLRCVRTCQAETIGLTNTLRWCYRVPYGTVLMNHW